MKVQGKIFLIVLLLFCSGLATAQNKSEATAWYIPHGAGVSPGQFSYHSISEDPRQRLWGYMLGGRGLLFWETDLIRFGPVFFSGTTRFQDQPNVGKGLFPDACVDCYYFTGQRKETGGGGMIETNLDINRGLWSFFRPLFGSEITCVQINQRIQSVYFQNGRIKMPSPIDYTGHRKFYEFRIGFYLGAESKFNDFISMRVTTSLDLAARNWMVLPVGSYVFLPIPIEGTNLRLAPLHSLMVVVRLR